MLEPSIHDKRRWWSREDLVVLVLFAALFFLPGLAQIPLFDRDEPRFASAAREMAERNDFLIPHFNGQLRPDKPPLVYWLMNGVHLLTGTWNELTVRLPSAICGTLTLLVVYLMVGSRFGRVTGLIAALMLGSSGAFIAESRLATADSTMLFFIVVCMACAWQAWDAGPPLGGAPNRILPRTDYLLDRSTRPGETMLLDRLAFATPQRMSWGIALLFWISLAAGALTKGVPLLFVLCPMIVLSIATGTIATHIQQWRSHLHVTRIRIGVALGVAVIATAVLLGTARTGSMELRAWTIILAILFIAMVLTPGLPGVTVRCITGGNWRWWRNLRVSWGVPLLIILIGAWALPAAMREPILLKKMVGIHFLQRAAGPLLEWLHIDLKDLATAGGTDAVEKYKQPPGYYLLLVWGTFWPWSVLLIPAAYHTFRRLLRKTAIAIDPRPYQFLVAWIIPMWVLLEVASGKLPHYPLPTYVGLAILCADALVQSWHRLTDVLAAGWFIHARWLILLIWCALGGAALLVANRYLEPDLFWPCVLLAASCLAAGVAGTIAWNLPSWPFVTVLGWGAVLLFANTLVVPQTTELQVSKRVAAHMLELRAADPDLQFAAVGPTMPGQTAGLLKAKAPGFQEPSLVFYTGGPVQMSFPTPSDISVEDMLKTIPFAPAAKISDHEKFLIAVDQPTLEYLRRRTPSVIFYELRHFDGINTATAKPIRVTVIANALPRGVLPALTPKTQSSTAP